MAHINQFVSSSLSELVLFRCAAFSFEGIERHDRPLKLDLNRVNRLDLDGLTDFSHALNLSITNCIGLSCGADGLFDCADGVGGDFSCAVVALVL